MSKNVDLCLCRKLQDISDCICILLQVVVVFEESIMIRYGCHIKKGLIVDEKF